MEQEIWKPIKGYEGLYEVSNLGNARSLDRQVRYSIAGRRVIKGKLLKNYVNNRGYVRIGVYKSGAIVNKGMHRVVAEAFLPNPENKPDVNHINGIKTDNRVENLEWATHYDNMQHFLNSGLNKKKFNNTMLFKIQQFAQWYNDRAKSEVISATDILDFAEHKVRKRNNGVALKAIELNTQPAPQQ